MTFYYEGIARLDWGMGNPNRTAALIACLMVGVWALAGFRKWGFWAAWLLSTALGFLLVQTFSRGGLLAATVGLGVLVLFSGRPWPRLRAALICASLVAIVAYSFTLSASERVATAWQGDPSVLNRLELWKHVPHMLADAPSGWGLNRSQQAYMQWYQGTERQERFLNLVSTHFTLLAELPWAGRIVYAIVWALALLLVFPSPRLPQLATAFAVLLTFLVAGIFTHFAESWPVYIPPFLAIVAALFLRLRNRVWPPRVHILGAIAAALLLIVPMQLFGSSRPPIRGTSARLEVGPAPIETWVLVSQDVLGRDYGKTLRNYYRETGAPLSLGFASELSSIPVAKNLVLSGTVDPAVLQHELSRIQPQRLILLNPSLFPTQIPAPIRAEAIFGELAPSATFGVWRASAITLPGEGVYLPSWPAALQRQLRNQ